MNPFISFLLLSLLITSCTNIKTHSLKTWWNEPQTIDQIEREYDQFLSTLRPTVSSSASCIQYATEDVIELSSEREVSIQKCIKYVTFEQEFLDEAFQNYLDISRLAHQPEWKKIKSEWREGDQLRTYSAPPFKGGFGIVLIRDGKLIHIYEQSFQ